MRKKIKATKRYSGSTQNNTNTNADIKIYFMSNNTKT